MTFVILDKIEKKDLMQNGNVFDVTPYNYILNRKSAFLDGEFVKNDHQMLQDVLKNFELIDPELLEILDYSQEINDGTKNTSMTNITKE